MTDKPKKRGYVALFTHKEWADKVEHIAAAIAKTCYDHDLAMSKYDRERKVMWDDADLLRALAKDLRGPNGQLAHELGRDRLPWESA